MRVVKGYTTMERSGRGGSNGMSFVQQILHTDQFVMFGPGRLATSNAHGANENIYVQDLVDEVKELIYYLAF